MTRINVDVSIDNYVIQSNMETDTNEIFTFVVMNCPSDCPDITASSCPSCPYREESREKAILDEYEPKMVEAIRQVAQIVTIHRGDY